MTHSEVISQRFETLPQRGLTLEQAASYCGVGPSNYRKWIDLGKVPGPIPGTKRYDKKALDLALDRLSNLSSNSENSVYDDWKGSQGESRT